MPDPAHQLPARAARHRRRFADLCRDIQSTPPRAADALGFVARPLAEAHLPYRPVPDDTYTRRNGRLRLHLQAPPDVGLPYGRYPRLLLAWVVTEAVRTRSPELHLGPSLSAFMRRLGLIPAGGSHGPIRRLRDQMQRLFSTTVVVTWRGEHEFSVEGFRIAASSYLWWHPARAGATAAPSAHAAAATAGTLTLSLDLFHEIQRAPIPVDLRALSALTSPLALDLYTWLTYRLYRLRRPTPIPWPDLYAQFGTQTTRLRDFRRGLLAALDPVLRVYPHARVRAGADHLLLLPSPTHVPP
jgi:hypothetical protein